MNNEGNHPYKAVEEAGVSLDGGHCVRNGRYFGTLTGDANELDAAINAMAAFGVQELTALEATAWRDSFIVVTP